MVTGTEQVQVPVTPTGAARPHFASLDGARAVAALAVVLAHVSLLSGLNVRNRALGPYLARADVGVSIFFLLSGFLLYRPFVAARFDGRAGGSTRRYALRRALRIVPAYWFVVTIVAFVLKAPAFTGPHNIIAHYLLLHVYDLPQVTGGPVQQSWSLATEVSFYVFLPMWAALLGFRRLAPRSQLKLEIGALVVLWCAAMALKFAVLAAGVSAEHMGWYGIWLPFRLDEFALGMTMAVVSAWYSHRDSKPRLTEGPAFAAGCWALAAGLFWFTCTQLALPLGPLFTARQAVVVRIFYAFVALFVLLPAVFGRAEGGVVRALLTNRVLVWLGLISYGIYIWHEAWQDLFLRWFDHQAFVTPFWQMLGFTVALTLMSAAVSWYLVERPALRLKDGLAAARRYRRHDASHRSTS